MKKIVIITLTLLFSGSLMAQKKYKYYYVLVADMKVYYYDFHNTKKYEQIYYVAGGNDSYIYSYATNNKELEHIFSKKILSKFRKYLKQSPHLKLDSDYDVDYFWEVSSDSSKLKNDINKFKDRYPYGQIFDVSNYLNDIKGKFF